ncbi:MAG: hypothetical protein ACO1N0_18495 [Fluviicola sp.]
MKNLIIAFCLLLSFGSQAQVFHVSDSSALLVKTTSQSPAHWYIQVYSDCPVDTTLRWKATHFDNIPPEWEISMDDQTISHFNVAVGDSADFNLLANQPFATKLIIGAMLNGTPGHGICYFDVYLPEDPSQFQTISYEFIVTPSTNGIADLEDSFLEWKAGILKVKGEKDASFEVFDHSGRLVKKELSNQLIISDLPKDQSLIIKVKLDQKHAIVKIYN